MAQSDHHIRMCSSRKRSLGHDSQGVKYIRLCRVNLVVPQCRCCYPRPNKRPVLPSLCRCHFILTCGGTLSLLHPLLFTVNIAFELLDFSSSTLPSSRLLMASKPPCMRCPQVEIDLLNHGDDLSKCQKQVQPDGKRYTFESLWPDLTGEKSKDFKDTGKHLLNIFLSSCTGSCYLQSHVLAVETLTDLYQMGS